MNVYFKIRQTFMEEWMLEYSHAFLQRMVAKATRAGGKTPLREECISTIAHWRNNRFLNKWIKENFPKDYLSGRDFPIGSDDLKRLAKEIGSGDDGMKLFIEEVIDSLKYWGLQEEDRYELLCRSTR